MRARRTLLFSGLAGLLAAALAALGLREFLFTDYDIEARPAFDALVGGDLLGFLERLPAYAGGMILRAPFAVAADLAGGGQIAVYRAVAVPGIVALAVIAVLLARRLPGWAAWVTLAAVLANPLALSALQIGHPEELMGAALCVGAVWAGLANRPILAGVLLGLAVGNKAWGVLAIGPVLLALRDRRIWALLIAGAIATALTLPVLLAAGQAMRPAGITGATFQPWQAWWFLGHHGAEVTGTFGNVKEGYRTAPAWVSPFPRPLIILLAVPLTLAAARARGRRPEDALLLLSLLLLIRCWLDPWNIAYYAIPAVVALVAWEVVRGRAPWGALAVTALTWTTSVLLQPVASPDLQAALYLAWVLPATALLALRLLWPTTAQAQATRMGARLVVLLPNLARHVGAAEVTGRGSDPSAAR